MSLWKKNVLLLLAVAIIIAVPLFVVKDSEFAGTDGASGDVIAEIAPEYQPWFGSVFVLPGGEMETLVFTLQAAIGAGVIGFVLGRITKKQPKKSEEK